MLLHFLSGFLPELVASSPSSILAATIHASPLSFLYDGYSAVYAFFCLSGYVLTRSYERKCRSSSLQILARAVRLGLPALAATVFAAGLMLMSGKANVEAGKILGSAWLSRQWDIDVSVLSILRDGTLNALLLGYRDLSAETLLSPWQTELSHSFVAPLWTLSIEFHGSILILFLCWCARQPAWFWITIVIVGTLFTIRSAYVCFFVGHLLASAYHAERPPSYRKLPAMAFVVSGLYCCVLADVWQPGWLIGLCSFATPWLFPGQFPPCSRKRMARC
ncbi:acyltransferase family protein [Bradyrhizobium oligotrophicum S58]